MLVRLEHSEGEYSINGEIMAKTVWLYGVEKNARICYNGNNQRAFCSAFMR
jgi:hypothetical protein